MTQIQSVKPNDTNYPRRLKFHDLKPPTLNYIGTPVWNQMPCVAIVGSRNPSSSALRWMDQEIADFLKKTKCCIVSGGAKGIDQAAHRIALLLKLPTIVFLPSGLLRPYPSEWKNWYQDVVSCGGAIISHLPNDAEIERQNFLIRNRWIVGISDAVLVVEAKRQSGTMVSAKHAAELNIDMGVVPSSPMDPGLGGLDLLRDGAFLIRDSRDLLDLGQFPKLLGSEDQEQNIRHPTGYADW